MNYNNTHASIMCARARAQAYSDIKYFFIPDQYEYIKCLFFSRVCLREIDIVL